MKLTPLFTALTQLRIWHWQTRSHAQHKALGKAYETLDELFDSLVETYLGKYGRDEAKKAYTVKSESYNFTSSTELIDAVTYLSHSVLKEIDEVVNDEDRDLLVIRDDIEKAFNHTLYLLSLD